MPNDPSPEGLKDPRQPWLNDKNSIVLEGKFLDRFLSDCNPLRFLMFRQQELMCFFYREFGHRWRGIVERRVAIDASTFNREFIRLERPLWGFLIVDLFARGLGFKSGLDDALRRCWPLLEAQQRALGMPLPYRIRGKRPGSRSRRVVPKVDTPEIYRTNPDLIPFVRLCLAPFDYRTFIPDLGAFDYGIFNHVLRGGQGAAKRAEKLFRERWKQGSNVRRRRGRPYKAELSVAVHELGIDPEKPDDEPVMSSIVARYIRRRLDRDDPVLRRTLFMAGWHKEGEPRPTLGASSANATNAKPTACVPDVEPTKRPTEAPSEPRSETDKTTDP